MTVRGQRPPIAPPATIGILGGGQLGRMTALAARSMGYRIHVLDPDANCAASGVADRVVAARFDDVEAARDLARHCDVVTLEIEQIATSVLDAAAHYAPMRPASAPIGIIQDRARQKNWLRDQGFPVGPFRVIESAKELAAALKEFKDCFVKSSRGGYDGRGQVRLTDATRVDDARTALGQRPAVAEQALTLAGEMSVMVARRPSGETRVFPVALNHHERHALSWSVMPAPLPPEILAKAEALGSSIAEKMGIEGLLAVELFLTSDGDVLVNELAPRPHNSYHTSERACVTSQFEQLVRAVCDLPLGDVSIVRPGAIVNLFGDLWHNGGQPAWATALGHGGGTLRLHLYGKGDPRPARKMGHLSGVADTALDALSLVRAAAKKVGADTEPIPPTLAKFGITT